MVHIEVYTACDMTFGEVKRLLSSEGVLKYPEFNKEVEVHTVMSGFRIIKEV